MSSASKRRCKRLHQRIAFVYKPNKSEVIYRSELQ